jgi:hypothetical protein
MMTKAAKADQQRAIKAYHAAMLADDEWQAELRRRGISRYTLQARGEEGSDLRELYKHKLKADEENIRAIETLWHNQP